MGINSGFKGLKMVSRDSSRKDIYQKLKKKTECANRMKNAEEIKKKDANKDGRK